jgi:hypothetical protein
MSFVDIVKSLLSHPEFKVFLQDCHPLTYRMPAEIRYHEEPPAMHKTTFAGR